MELEGFLLDADYVTEGGRAVISSGARTGTEAHRHF